LGDLVECYSRVTPVIQEIFNGKHILTPKAVYRLKMKEKGSIKYPYNQNKHA
jgi:hypothetical protein